MNNISHKKKQRICNELGNNLKFARKKKRFQSQQVAESADISRPTLWKIEKGSPSVALGSYLNVIMVLGLEYDIMKIGIKETSIKSKRINRS